MTSVEWAYDARVDDGERRARRAAMDVADDVVRGFKFPQEKYSALELEAIEIRRSEVTWSDRRTDRPALRVQAGFSRVFWAVFLANLCLALLGALLYSLNR